MKNFIATLAALMLAALSLGAAGTADVNYVTKDYPCKNFTGISVSGIVQVNLVKARDCKVAATLPDRLEKYFEAKVSGGVLKISLVGVPKRLQNQLKDWKITVDVAMPELRSLDMSGVTKLDCEDTFDIGTRTFSMDLSGVSKVSCLRVRAGTLDVDMGGATSAVLAGEFDKVDADLGGAAKGTFNINARKIDLDLSGASKFTFKGEYDEIVLEASGASEFTLKGPARKISIEGSGASKVRAADWPVQEAWIDLSGAAKCEIDAVRRLSVDASGTSSLRYRDNGGLKIDRRSVSRSASVGKIR